MTAFAHFLRHFLHEGFLAGMAFMALVALALQSRLDRQRLSTALVMTIAGILFLIAALYARCDLDIGGCD
jgi:putative Ca2+/H+ antiporter (TMEM165/GDT1 family)